MRRAPAWVQPPSTLRVDLEERIRVTAERLARLPDDQVTSLSVTTGWQGRHEADVRRLARSAAAAAGLAVTVEAADDVVTVRFGRTTRVVEGAD
jgi:hypothetical protein